MVRTGWVLLSLGLAQGTASAQPLPQGNAGRFGNIRIATEPANRHAGSRALEFTSPMQAAELSNGREPRARRALPRPARRRCGQSMGSLHQTGFLARLAGQRLGGVPPGHGGGQQSHPPSTTLAGGRGEADGRRRGHPCPPSRIKPRLGLRADFLRQAGASLLRSLDGAAA
jgi:hypothetical protein